MHNVFNRALREVLGLDRMQAEFTSDVTEISNFLQREHQRQTAEAERRRSTRFWFFAVIGTGILAALSVGTLVKQVLEHLNLIREIWNSRFTLLADPAAVLEREKGAEFFGVLVGLVVMFFACIGGYLNRPRRNGARGGYEDDTFAEKASKEVVVHRSLGEL